MTKLVKKTRVKLSLIYDNIAYKKTSSVQSEALNSVQSNYSNLQNQFSNLQREIDRNNDSQSNLREKYNSLVDEYNELRGRYNELVDKYNNLARSTIDRSSFERVDA